MFAVETTSNFDSWLKHLKPELNKNKVSNEVLFSVYVSSNVAAMDTMMGQK